MHCESMPLLASHAGAHSADDEPPVAPLPPEPPAPADEPPLPDAPELPPSQPVKVVVAATPIEPHTRTANNFVKRMMSLLKGGASQRPIRNAISTSCAGRGSDSGRAPLPAARRAQRPSKRRAPREPPGKARGSRTSVQTVPASLRSFDAPTRSLYSIGTSITR